ncbi:MAG: 4'-phosphopantetheinyl transferase superfamily protein [Ruminococcaceae bacterium]|nr:4'-phosphopantetheinyl transferase superfamily protein [Oscillospiraceae bacterium]
MSRRSVTVYLYPEQSPLPRLDRLRDAAARFTGRQTALWTRAEYEGGKPYFPEAPELCFSVSHSGDYWVCAFSSVPVGIDLQQHRPCNIPRLSQRFFHPEEDAFLYARGYAEPDFFSVWTAKESWVKRTGTGLSIGLDSFSVVSPPSSPVLQYLPAPAGYTMCLCTDLPADVTVVDTAVVPKF